MRLMYLIYAAMFIVALSYGQSSGYMGKRLFFGYAFNTCPALWGSNANNKTISGTEGNAESGKIAFNVLHEGFFECILSSKWTMGLNARYYKTTYDNATMMVETNRDLIYNSRTTPEGFYTIKGLSYGLYFKLFTAKSVAPWGKYIQFGPVLNTANAFYNPNEMYVNAQTQYAVNYSYERRDTLLTDFGSQKQSYKGFNFMFGFGKSRIFYNKLIVDYGCNMYLLSAFPNIALTYKQDITTQNYIQKTINRRIRGINHFNAFIKIAYLI